MRSLLPRHVLPNPLTSGNREPPAHNRSVGIGLTAVQVVTATLSASVSLPFPWVRRIIAIFPLPHRRQGHRAVYCGCPGDEPRATATAAPYYPPGVSTTAAANGDDFEVVVDADGALRVSADELARHGVRPGTHLRLVPQHQPRPQRRRAHGPLVG